MRTRPFASSISEVSQLFRSAGARTLGISGVCRGGKYGYGIEGALNGSGAEDLSEVP